jgi:hypothetical protein
MQVLAHHRPPRTYRRFLSLLERLYSHSTRDVELTGGEPLLHPDFLDIFHFRVEKFKIVVVATNGLLLDEDLAGQLARHTNVEEWINFPSQSRFLICDREYPVISLSLILPAM